ncbi:hypothetical protein P154DRAFT_523408 [Amniculicola lignicola CBS 123094]|uniref:C3H1-type domain-containing protein n=1 Tax=Amniculicola lignicola CBS 123094 TaxID=1392246 RepID=A0A6A5WGW8_9PLEO|nr:hypothetical protein P154DRAFT_523408 [Amniculicola lignicola CBS 123094]
MPPQPAQIILSKSSPRMTSFRFPPPPPPPPKAAASDDAPQYASNQRGGFDNGRGGRGRGQRGRGWLGRGGNASRGGYSQERANERPQYDGGSRGGFPTSTRGGYQQQGYAQGQSYPQQQQQFPPLHNAYSIPPLPVGAHMNPNLIPQSQAGGANQWQQPASQAGLVHAMSTLSSHGAVPSISSFTNHMTSPPQPPQIAQSSSYGANQPYPSSQGNGNKRKRNERASGPHRNQASPPAETKQAKQKPPRAKAAPPPAVPSFGFSVPAPKAPAPPSRYAKPNSKKPKVNLGFNIKQESDNESSNEEDIDEEAAYRNQFKGIPGLVFEHKGEMISIQTPEEMEAWVKDRRKQYPTQKRIVQKAAKSLRLRKRELRFLQNFTPGNRKGVSSTKEADHMVVDEIPVTRELNAAQQVMNPPDPTDLHPSLDTSLKKVERQIGTTRPAPASRAGSLKKPAVDLGLGYSSDSDDESSVLSDSSVVSSSEDSDDDSDSGPEEQSVRTKHEICVKEELDAKQESDVKQESSIKDEPNVKHESNVKGEPIVKHEPEVKAESHIKHESHMKQDTDSDSGPEEQSSKINVESDIKQQSKIKQEPIVKPPPTSTSRPATEQTGRLKPKTEHGQVCFQFKQTGRCKFGKNCRWAHPVKQERKRKTLYETMVEKEVEQADRRALDAIKYLGRNGFLG